MIPSVEALPRKSRLAALLPEVLLLVVCGTIADCDDYEDIAAWCLVSDDWLEPDGVLRGMMLLRQMGVI